jgi:hypothetical protein
VRDHLYLYFFPPPSHSRTNYSFPNPSYTFSDNSLICLAKLCIIKMLRGSNLPVIGVTNSNPRVRFAKVEVLGLILLEKKCVVV